MALFDFFRRRRDPEGKPAKSTGRLGRWFSGLFGRSRKKQPEVEPLPEPAPMEEPDISVDDQLFESLEDVYTSDQEQPASYSVDDLSQVTIESDRDLLDRYSGMLDTMVDKGYIQPFDSDEDAAKFLRVLSSEAWEEAHAYWYSIEALQQIQDAIQRGATAGRLQEEYNRQKEKKSKNYLRTWDEWRAYSD